MAVWWPWNARLTPGWTELPGITQLRQASGGLGARAPLRCQEQGASACSSVPWVVCHQCQPLQPARGCFPKSCSRSSTRKHYFDLKRVGGGTFSLNFTLHQDEPQATEACRKQKSPNRNDTSHPVEKHSPRDRGLRLRKGHTGIFEPFLSPILFLLPRLSNPECGSVVFLLN